MRRLVIAIGAVLVLVVANIGIYQKQQLVDSGRVVLLELAPVDPRSLMQGDYMALRFRAEADAFGASDLQMLEDGRLVLAVDDRNVATFVRIDNGTPLGPGEIVMRYRIRGGAAKFATNAYFFQEGTADLYASARFGEFRVSDAGDAILTRMRNEKLEVLGSPDPR
jgi:uncharacterized membrane-anchored protein